MEPLIPPRDAWKPTAALLLSATALVLALVAVLVAGTATGGTSSSRAPGTAQPAATARVTVDLVEMAVRPSTIQVPANAEILVTAVNRGRQRHDLKLNGERGTRLLAPGESETVSFGALTQDADAWCTVPGHRAAGMVLRIDVTGADAVTGAGAADGSGRAQGPAADGTTGGSARLDPAAVPPAGWAPYDPVLRPAPRAKEHRLTIRAEDKVLEVAPGVRQRMWTFNGTVPGPVLRGRVGDLFTVRFANAGTIGHSIDFHASEVAPNREMRTLEPGQSLVYQFRAQRAGIWMYHCGTPPVLHHIGNGMYGALVIDPPGLPRVDRELVLVQSDLYFGPPDEIGDLAKMKAATPDAVAFNGYAAAYHHRPIRVKARERIRAWVLAAGPNAPSAFHVVGSQFEAVWKEGAWVLRSGTPGGAQALDLAPSQGGFVEFTLDRPGAYPFVSHRWADADKGAAGVLEAR